MEESMCPPVSDAANPSIPERKPPAEYKAVTLSGLEPAERYKAVVEQYKAYVVDLGNIGSRYATTQTFYLSVVSGLIAVVAFAGKDAGAFQKYAGIIAFFVTASIAVICYVWWRALDFYYRLFGAKFAVLKQIEKEMDLFKVFDWEWFELKKRGYFSLVTHEKFTPCNNWALRFGRRSVLDC
jgi:hypothetical protein